MKREMDLIRALMLKLEALPMRPNGIVTLHPDSEEFSVPGYSPEQIADHLKCIRDAGWIDDCGDRLLSGEFSFHCLTNAGHDFLDSVRDERVWKKTKNAAEAAGGWTVDLLKDLAKGFLKTQIKKQTGIEL